MDDQLQSELYDKYPEMFSNKTKPITESCMAFGIECGSGWYDIINKLCYRIKNHEEHLKIKEIYFEPVKFDQIKEKFGLLRIYFSGGDNYIKGLVNMAEDISETICENCGNKGKPNEKGWIATLCENCRSKK